MSLQSKTIASYTSSNGYTLLLELTEDSISPESNSSAVSWVLRMTSSGWNFSTYHMGWNVKLDGESVSCCDLASSPQLSLGKYSSVTIASGSAAVAHGADGTLSLSAEAETCMSSASYTPGNMSLSGSMYLTAIPRATAPVLSPKTAAVGDTLSISLAAAASGLSHRLYYSIGSVSDEELGQVSGSGSFLWTLPESLAAEITDSCSGEVTVTCRTYSGDNLLGRKSDKLTVTIPDTAEYQPEISAVFAPSPAVSSAFDGLYIQGKSKVSAVVTAMGRHGAAVVSYGFAAENCSEENTDGSFVTSDFLSGSGRTEVRAYAVDSRGLSSCIKEYITVIPYQRPSAAPYTGMTGIVCRRCDDSGAADISGKNLHILAGRSYSPVISGGEQKNFCLLRYRIKKATDTDFGEWKTLIAKDSASDAVDTVEYGMVSSVTDIYNLEISALDDLGEETVFPAEIPAEDCTLHLKNGGKAVGVGMYVEREKDNSFHVAWDTELHRGLTVGGDTALDGGLEVGRAADITGNLNVSGNIIGGGLRSDYLPLSGGRITGDLRVEGHIYPADGTVLIASGSMTGGSSTWYISGNADFGICKNILIALVVRSYSGSNLYTTYTFPAVADTWSIYIPYANDFYRAAVTISGTGANGRVLLQIDSSCFSTTAYVYAMN